MAEHEKTRTSMSLSITRAWNDIDPKVIVGAASSITVGAVVSAGALVGWDVPVPLAAAIVIVVYFVASYLTRSKVPVADDSGLTAQQAAVAASAASAGDALADEDWQQLAVDAFHAAGLALDPDGVVEDPEHPLVAGADENRAE